MSGPDVIYSRFLRAWMFFIFAMIGRVITLVLMAYEKDTTWTGFFTIAIIAMWMFFFGVLWDVWKMRKD